MRNRCLPILTAVVCVLAAQAMPTWAAERPNILLVMVDDMRWSDLGCYGGEIDTSLRDTKQSAYEGGIRTPLIARWRGRMS